MFDGNGVRVYGRMLECAEAQAAAVEVEDWQAYDGLAAQRRQLLDASEQALAGTKLGETERAADLIRAVLATDAETNTALETKQAQLRERSGQFRRLVIAAAAYRSPNPPRSLRQLIDTRS